MKRMLAASTIVVVVAIATALSPGSGVASRGVPAGLVGAIHARLGAGLVRFSSGLSPHALSSGLSPHEPPGYFGFKVSLSADGTTALVGAPAVGADTGAAYIFRVSSAGSWSSRSIPSATLTHANGYFFDEFGVSVALSADGTTAFIGAPFSGGGISGGNGGDSIGAVYVFHASSEAAWASSSRPKAALTVAGAFLTGLTLAVSADGTTLVVGDPFHGFLAGGAEIFHVTSENAWVSSSTPTAVLSNAHEPANDFAVGETVAISGDGTTALLSNSEAGNGAGGGYVFHVASEAAWASSTSPTAILSDAHGDAHDGLGFALALSGDGTTALLGGPFVQGGVGAADVFHVSGASNWVSSSTPTAILFNADGSNRDLLGYSVSLSASGATAVATGWGVNADRGAAYVFHVASENGWASSSVPTATLTNSAGAFYDSLGVGLALSADGATALAGAPGSAYFVGAGDVFHVSGETSWATSSTPTAKLTDSALLHAPCVVPRVKGLRLYVAQEVLFGFGCRSGEVDNAYAPFRVGHVIAENPKPGTTHPLGTKVNLVLSLGPWHK